MLGMHPYAPAPFALRIATTPAALACRLPQRSTQPAFRCGGERVRG